MHFLDGWTDEGQICANGQMEQNHTGPDPRPRVSTITTEGRLGQRTRPYHGRESKTRLHAEIAHDQKTTSILGSKGTQLLVGVRKLSCVSVFAMSGYRADIQLTLPINPPTSPLMKEPPYPLSPPCL